MCALGSEWVKGFFKKININIILLYHGISMILEVCLFLGIWEDSYLLSGSFVGRGLD